MNVLYAPRALREIDEILAYISIRSSRGAHNVSIAIESAAQACAFRPHAGLKTSKRGLYRWPLVRYRFTIFYRPLDDGSGIEVAVVRGARVKKLSRMPPER
jgi:plasmid stabilization system protein ParE